MLFIIYSSLLGFYLHMISRKVTDMKKPSCLKRLKREINKKVMMMMLMMVVTMMKYFIKTYL